MANGIVARIVISCEQCGEKCERTSPRQKRCVECSKIYHKQALKDWRAGNKEKIDVHRENERVKRGRKRDQPGYKKTFGLAKCVICNFDFQKPSPASRTCTVNCRKVYQQLARKQKWALSRIGFAKPQKKHNCKRCGIDVTEPSGKFRKVCDECASKKKKEGLKAWRLKNAEKLVEKEKSRVRCKVTMNARRKAKRQENPEAWRAWWEVYYEKNREAIIKKSTARRLQKRKDDPRAKIEHRISSSILKEMRRRNTTKSMRTLEYVGCTASELLDHLLTHPSNSKGAFTAENYGGVWHIDHIRPVASFSDDEIHRAWNLENLQPLLAKENLRKNSTWMGIRWQRKDLTQVG